MGTRTSRATKSAAENAAFEDGDRVFASKPTPDPTADQRPEERAESTRCPGRVIRHYDLRIEHVHAASHDHAVRESP
jgi:hypothetical protein